MQLPGGDAAVGLQGGSHANTAVFSAGAAHVTRMLFMLQEGRRKCVPQGVQ
jgi:hypothetical protein